MPLHCSKKQKLSFVSVSTQELQREMLENRRFCHTLFLENDAKITGKKYSEPCFSTKTKATCQKSVIYLLFILFFILEQAFYIFYFFNFISLLFILFKYKLNS